MAQASFPRSQWPELGSTFHAMASPSQPAVQIATRDPGVVSAALASRLALLKSQPRPTADVTQITAVPGWEGLDWDSYKELLDHHFGISQNAHIGLITKKGKFAVSRDRCNDRGDESTELRREKSIATVGYRPEVGRQPFLIQADSGEDDEWGAAHCASIIGGIKRARSNVANADNRVVQNTIACGLPNCHTYVRATPDWGRTFLKNLGNLTNSEVTETTFMEKIRATKLVEAGFLRKKALGKWFLRMSSVPVAPSSRCRLEICFDNLGRQFLTQILSPKK